eukprot:3952528-Pleurochrysis_carterae.AAC.1
MVQLISRELVIRVAVVRKMVRTSRLSGIRESTLGLSFDCYSSTSLSTQTFCCLCRARLPRADPIVFSPLTRFDHSIVLSYFSRNVQPGCTPAAMLKTLSAALLPAGGLTGNVTFDQKSGDRPVSSAHYSLNSVLYNRSTEKFSFVNKGIFANGQWVWGGGARDLVYNYMSTDEPVAQLHPPPPPLPPPPLPPSPPISTTGLPVGLLSLVAVAVLIVGLIFCT